MPNQSGISTVLLSYENIQITEDDLECLKTGRYLNDKIINFYLKYMYCNLLNEEQRQKVHIFDSFFSEALDQMDESRVVRWLRRVNIFEKDYILVPALIDEHWFLIIICHPIGITADQRNGNNNDMFSWHKRPRLVIMDSMRHHTKDKKPQLIRYLYDFLRSACVIQKNMSRDDICRLSTRVPNFESEVKEQANSYDCGICMLENAEKFFIDKFNIDSGIDPEVEFRLSAARLKRNALRKHIKRLAEQIEIEKAMNGTH